MRLTFLAALAAAAALALTGCGANSESATGNGVDRAFVAAMIPHHQSAVDMAKIAQQRGQSEFVEKLAGDIIRTQNAEIATMRREDAALAQAGVKPGRLGIPEHMMGMDGDTSMLERAEPFDPAFLKMMIPHHEGAVTMAKAELAKGGDAQLTRLAQIIITAQEREIREMRTASGASAASMGDSGTTDEHSSR